ncbi:conserved hypothetical protein [Loktanella fryxellensis]|uniref:TIGR02117 family protein n=1 Tax=Loktanella fryxellensis TaxID=245187 RepID=A0A1H8CU35_9RHOB|nr:TIGR02117 family protein [Loktanella fryxellensis]SEM97657.1 conserved hypothetical protein [Loktanella fryxellensis]
MIRRLALAVLLAPVLYLLAGTLGGAIRIGEVADPPDAAVLLLHGPIHTDIVLPVTPEVRRSFAFLKASGMAMDDPAIRWIVIGWGARDFYMRTATASDLAIGPVMRAIAGDSAVIRVETGGTEWDTSQLAQVPLTAAQFTRLVGTIRDSFADTVPLAGPGFNAFDAFYPAHGRFNLLRTCNVWVGNVLRQAGARVGIWTPFTWTLV